MVQKAENQRKRREKLKLKTLPNNINTSFLPSVDFIMFLLSIARLAKSSTIFVHILSPFDNELIKHYPREA
jgi:hypothetical protein